MPYRLFSLIFLGLAVAQVVDAKQLLVDLIPITDLESQPYLEHFEGGLYPNRTNEIPAKHLETGLQRAQKIQPVDGFGNPNSNGKYVLLSIGMSNTTQEFRKFMNLAAAHPQVNRRFLKIVDGASGGQTAFTWDSPLDPNYDRIRDTKLARHDLSEAQVQAAWVKVANARPKVSLPDEDADAFTLVKKMSDITRALKIRYPNLQQIFFSSRIYAGFALTPLNPEPFAYESGFAVKWLIESQINQMAGKDDHRLAGDLNYDTIAPWIAWGPYLWANGLTPRNDGLIWKPEDFQHDGTHPSKSGSTKVGQMLLDFMLTSPATTTWFNRINE